MSRRLIYPFIVVLLTVTVGIIFMIHQRATPTITFFPIDRHSQFKTSYTSLAIANPSKQPMYQLHWQIGSQTDSPLYLRQDVSLLFANGKLQGVRSKWSEQVDTIEMSETLTSQTNALWEAISFHHGEKHGTNGTINSVQHMSSNQLFVLKCDDGTFYSIKQCQNTESLLAKNQLKQSINQQLHLQLTELIDHFNISKENYLIIPLTDLFPLNNKNLPTLSQQQTEQIIGQLWEGLYKNYVLVAAQMKQSPSTNYVPFILFDKHHQHLIVLFELDGQKKMLVQRYHEN